MKNLKKLLAMSLALAMIISSLSAVFTVSAYDDVTTSNGTLYEAVTVLSDFGIVNGKDATNFGAADAIKRSEAAKLLVCALGLKSAAEASMGKTAFTDVAADHWASGYINVASSQGLISGYGDGKFGPDDNVTYEQFLKMGMTAAGYQPVALAKGGFPTGYVVAANDSGVTKGVKVNGPANATRGDIAIMLYNLLSTPIMEQTGWGNNIEYKVQDGKTNDTNLKTIMTEKLNIKKFRVLVTANDKSSIKSTTAANQGKIKYLIQDDYNLDDADYQEGTTPESPKVGTTKAADYLGYRAVIYIGQDETYKEDYVASIVADIARVNELNLKQKKYLDLKDTTATTLQNGKFYYWIDPDNDKDSTEAEIDSNASLMINGQYVTDMSNATDFFNKLNGITNGSYKFINNNTNEDDTYDLVYITTYHYGVVDSVDLDNKKIDFKEYDTVDSYLSFDPDEFYDKNKFTYTLTDKSGAKIELNSIKENDVVAIAFSGTADSLADAKYMNVVVLKDSVTGTVTEKIDSTGEFRIGDKLYKLNSTVTPSVDLETEGQFFLDLDGNIIYTIKDPIHNSSYNYNYLITAGAGASLDDDYSIKTFDKAGITAVSKLASTVKVYYDANNYVSYSTSNPEGKQLADLVNFLKVYTMNPDGKDTNGVAYGSYDNFKTTNAAELKATVAYSKVATIQTKMDKLIDLRNISKQNLVASKVVDITVNSNKEVTKICFPNVSINGGAVAAQTDAEDMTLSDNVKDLEYKSDTKSFNDKYFMNDASKVFYIPENEQTTYDSFELRTPTSFSNDQKYSAAVFDVDDADVAGLVLVTDDTGFTAYDSRLAVIDRIGSVVVDGNTMPSLTMVVDGKTVTATLSSKGYKVYTPNNADPVLKDSIDGTSDIDDVTPIEIVPGDAVQYTLNGAGYINSIARIFDYANQKLEASTTKDATKDEYANEDATFIFGRVADTGTPIKLQKSDVVNLTKAISSSDVRYVQYDGTRDRDNKTTIIGGVKEKDSNGNKCYVVARKYNNRAFDIVQYIFSDATKAEANILVD